VNIRPFGPDDVEPLCALVDADRLPGQPACTTEMVRAVMAGRSTVDAWWWSQLATMRVVVAEDGSGRLVGAGAMGRWPSGTRYLLWLHGAEDREVLDAVLWSLLRGVRRPDPIFAFWFATELSVGLEGLPRAARPHTHEALLARGFVGEDRWLYLRATGAGSPPTAQYRTRGLGGELRVELTAGNEVVGGAEVSLPAPGFGVLWWLEIEPEHRRRGRGRELLRAARAVLAEAGAQEMILFVDRDDPVARDRRPALALYESEGFATVDHLWSYRRGEVPPDERPGRG
jgi:ribosomal protein S18 acetylase RimI-like enzyme